jgi:hypothetical protein
MKTIVILLALTTAIAFLTACGRRGGSTGATKEIIVGGLYASRSEDGTYLVSKVLAVDDTAVHVRIYKNKFQILPQNLDSSTLSLGKFGDADGFGIGHAPIAKEGWLDKRVFLQNEPVREDELDGYKYYLEEMNK